LPSISLRMPEAILTRPSSWPLSLTRLHPNYLQALSIRHFCVAGAIKGDNGSARPRWFCAVGSKEELRLSSADQARRYLEKVCPPILEMTSEECVAAFAGRTSYHVGQSATCSQLRGGRVVLLGDAAAPFPPIGQGVNAAMESALVLDEVLAKPGVDLRDAAARYSAAWKPESDAVTGSANGCCSIIHSTRCARLSPWPSE
jgi:kynurenine 3-monooxygenase